ncbi:GSU2403 family nucleotidyltransferase fold protein [Bradyrhizobium sp. Gha]|uniref:nucleotidyltransferase family protein n=1 Tax=Bradyrhizobium sp. Gha TaxID=1855318 RepID=UPI0008E4495F|nr:GSU2403 family nucleotidyltransferase fold protein [Bradyrhizobium sp. Gha]SFJ58843.1 hypothetical protein SAMN05216525_12915 [Bradyrhizobium sp. Gha]
MKQFSNIDQVMFSDLVQKATDAEFDENFPENGTFLKQKRANREYYYYKAYETSGGQGPTKTALKYVGPADNPEIAKRAQAFQRTKIGYRARRELAAKLRRAGYPAPPHMEGLVVSELARAGLFRLRATLVGSMAYQTYSGVLGVRLPDELVTTEDMDIAKFYGISISIDDSMPDIEDILKKVDPTFAPSFSPDETKLFSGFANAAGFKVEFLTPNRGDEDYSSRLTKMPSLGPSVGAQVLRFLDYLIHEPIRSVVLHDAGVPVLVPAPERYAIHKLIVATKRNVFFAAKAKKDINQADALIQAFDTAKRGSDLGFAWMEAWERGAGWRRRLGVGALRLSDNTFAMLSKSVAEAAKLDGKSADEYGVTRGKDGLLARVSIAKAAAAPAP